jgi:hypothetical protein
MEVVQNPVWRLPCLMLCLLLMFLPWCLTADAHPVTQIADNVIVGAESSSDTN